MIRLSKSTIGPEEKAAVAAVLDHEFLGMGQEVMHFEAEIKAYFGTDKEVVCVNTGTSALHLAVEALDIEPGDEILVPSLTYVASYAAISAAGATPVSCDVDADSVFIDLDDAQKRLSSRSRAIMPVHYSGDASQMEEVYAFAMKHDLRVIEDAAHSFGSTYNGKRVGCSGDILCFSFDGIKNITSGEGGAVVSGDKELIERIKDARLLGVQKDTEKRYAGARSWDFDVIHQGYRYHMSNIFAAIGREQLKKMTYVKHTRQTLVSSYLKLFAGIDGIELLKLDYDNTVAHIFVIKVVNGQRDVLKEHLDAKGIGCGIHYKPNHLLTLYKTEYALPKSEALYEQILTLPLHLDLSVEEQQSIVQTIKAFLDSH